MFYGALIDPCSNEIALVMEWIEGVQLDDYVATRSPRPEVRHGLLTDVSNALRFLHAQRPPVVHGDLKGSNIRIECMSTQTAHEVVRAKLLDFGLARLVVKGSPALGGTMNWKAPEVFMNQCEPPQASADVFSFGRVVYLVGTGRRPLAGLTRAAIVNCAQKHGRVPPLVWPEDCPFRVESIALCDALLQFQPLLRPAMAEVAVELQAWRPVGLMSEVTPVANAASFKGALQYVRRQLVHPRQLRHRNVGTCAVTDTANTAGGAAAAAASAGDRRQGAVVRNACTGGEDDRRDALFEPEFLATPALTKLMVMLDNLFTWNCTVPPVACCVFHALAARELDHLQNSFAALECDAKFRPHHGWQCPACLLMDLSVSDTSTPTCFFCGYHKSRSDHMQAETMQVDGVNWHSCGGSSAGGGGNSADGDTAAYQL
eukprot:NODE_6972_length_1620_cov_6.072338.p1 GENE.NODE_6972_length_1620_cov_6.072338~~NODE_6972_length_1620_cov_6.072338.p1  ORF type:complete len:430 (-),score=102.59 NODE_6972_length_1620_cov_6.072338:329-1618(-)